MANKLISEMNVPKSIANIFTARNLFTAKALSCLSLHYQYNHAIRPFSSGNPIMDLSDSIHWAGIFHLSKFSRIPVLVTNQVRSQNRDAASQFAFQGAEGSPADIVEAHSSIESHLVPALGIHWAHAVTIRLVLEGAKSGGRFMVAKSPISPPMVFPFCISSSGIFLLSDVGLEVTGPQIYRIQTRGHGDIVNFRTEELL